jgi:uroporphyrinogen-III synthase
MVKGKVFISRKQSDCEAILAFLPKQVDVVAQSLIETTPISFDRNIPQTDWIFFSSSNAARHFFEQQPVISNQKLGAIGEATAKTIAHFRSVDFVGNSIDITDSAYRFAEAIGSAKVLFPGAAESLKHVQSALPAEQIIDFPVYTTAENNAPVPKCDVYVFSSPSNVRSYFNGDNPPYNLKCVAFGEATRDELMKYKVTNIHIPHSLEPQSIAHTIIQLLEG